MKNETNEMLNIIHKNHERANTEYKIETMIQEDRKKINKEKEIKQEISEQRALVMVSIGFILLSMFAIGLI